MKHFEVAKEELSFYGAENTSLQNILAVMIGPQADPEVTGKLAGLGINRLVELSLEELKEFKGIGEVSARRIMSGFGLANQIRRHQKQEGFVVRSPKDAASVFEDLEYKTQEYFEAIYLNVKNEILSRKTIFKGSLNASIVHPREVFKEGIRLSAASIIVAHNHPSGNSKPSRQDLKVTERLTEVGLLVGIEVIDHVIIGNGEWYSLQENGEI